MDTFIAAIAIVVVTGVLIALVRRWAEKASPRHDSDQIDAVDGDLSDIIGSFTDDA
jgi:hypothetical protein